MRLGFSLVFFSPCISCVALLPFVIPASPSFIIEKVENKNNKTKNQKMELWTIWTSNDEKEYNAVSFAVAAYQPISIII